MHDKKFVEPDIGHQVQRAVEEGEEPEHASQANQPVLPRYFAQRSDRQCDQQESQGAIAGTVSDLFNGIGAKLGVQSVPDEAGQRRQARQKDYGFEPSEHERWAGN